jgi:ADP-ribose pyrophosphatase YjhB (NUDIX family)
MDNDKVILNKEREEIFSLFIKEHRLRFSEIEKSIKIRSNHLNYHIKKMIDEGMLKKDGEYYSLTTEAEKIIPFFSHIIGKEKGCLPVVVIAVINNDKICLLKRKNRPYQGYWGMIGGKLKYDESIEESALREAKEEAGLDCKFERVISVLHERLIEDKIIKNSLVIFFCKLITNDLKIVAGLEGEIKWYPINNLPKDIIPSDKLMINELMDSNLSFKEVIMEEKNKKLVKIEVL